MSTSTTIQSTAERIGADMRRTGSLYHPPDFPELQARRVLHRLRPGDRCGPGGRYVVVDAGERERLAEFREMVAPSPGNGG